MLGTQELLPDFAQCEVLVALHLVLNYAKCLEQLQICLEFLLLSMILISPRI